MPVAVPKYGSLVRGKWGNEVNVHFESWIWYVISYCDVYVVNLDYVCANPLSGSMTIFLAKSVRFHKLREEKDV